MLRKKKRIFLSLYYSDVACNLSQQPQKEEICLSRSSVSFNPSRAIRSNANREGWVTSSQSLSLERFFRIFSPHIDGSESFFSPPSYVVVISAALLSETKKGGREGGRPDKSRQPADLLLRPLLPPLPPWPSPSSQRRRRDPMSLFSSFLLLLFFRRKRGRTEERVWMRRGGDGLIF